MKKCPHCNELLGDNVTICFNCHYNFDTGQVMNAGEISAAREEEKKITQQRIEEFKINEAKRITPKKWYDCTNCWNLEFLPIDTMDSVKCPLCGAPMRFVMLVQAYTDEEKKRRGTYCENEPPKHFGLRNKNNATPTSVPSVPTVECPYCHSANTQKISTSSVMLDNFIWGPFGTKRHKQWHCNNCKSDF